MRDRCGPQADLDAHASNQSLASIVCEIVERRLQYVITQFPRHEQDWRLSPGDGGDPTEVSEFALQRELSIELAARKRLADSDCSNQKVWRRSLEQERRSLKYFPVLFVSAPHIEDAVSGTFPGMPTPLLYSTAVLDRYLRIDEFPSMKVPEVIAVMNPSLYTAEFRQELTTCVRRHKPRLVGISNLSEGHHFALEIAKLVKSVSTETIVLLGGQHEDGTNPVVYRQTAARVDAMPPARREMYRLSEAALRRAGSLQTLARTEEREFIDFVAAGDGPYLLMELMKLLADHLDTSIAEFKRLVLASKDRFASLPGSGHLFLYDDDHKELRHVELSGSPIDGNALPFIFLDRLTHENRFPVFNYKKTAQVMACLGCKYACSFCHESADHFLYGVPKLLQRDPENVIKELDLRKEQGYEAAFFDDSTFTQNPPWLERLLRLMRERQCRGAFLEWGCQTTINDVTPPVLERMAAAGCTYIYFGIESARPGTDQVQKVRQLRVLTGEDDWAIRFKRVARWCHDAGIRVGTSLQFGLGESPEHRDQTMELVADLYRSGYIAKGCVALNINAPYPGTEQWVQLMGRADRRLPDYREKLVRHPAFETAHQFTQLPGDVIDEIYEQAAQRLGDAILSVDFEAHSKWRQLMMTTRQQ
jgi:radical SAM superfamily enzyme YgiQ (UPF0313 family)